MTRRTLSPVAGVGLVALLYAATASAQATSPSLGNAASYSVLAGSDVSNTGTTTISGDVGISPGIGVAPHYTGFGTVTFTGGGAVHDADVAAANAKFDRGAAFTALDQGCTFSYAGTKELAGVSLNPGVHCATSFHLTGGTLTLVGSSSDVWIFKSASDLIVTGGAPAKVVSPSCNVWWRVVSTATLDAGSSLTGNILASTQITLAAGASLTGRALAGTADVTLSSNAISACVAPVGSPGANVPPTISKVFAPASIAVGDISRVIVTLNNPNAVAISTTAAFTDVLPTGVVVAPVPGAATTCGAGSVAAPIGGSTLTLTSGSTIPAGSCTMSVNVTAAAAGTFVNTVPAGALQTTAGANALPASAPLAAVSIITTPVPPAPNCALTQTDLFIVKHHTDVFVVGTNATYSIAVFNNGATASSGTITVTDTLPTGLTFVSATGTGWTCTAAAQVVTCTTAGSVAAAGPFPNNITLTVLPVAAAVPGVTNTAIVTGGNDCSLTNNASADVTLVATAVPTLSEWAMIVLTMLLAAAGVIALRGRRTVA